MARPRTPYFPFYADEYLNDPAVQSLDCIEEGCFIRLLANLWLAPVRGVFCYPSGYPQTAPELPQIYLQPRLSSTPGVEKPANRATEIFKKFLRIGLIRQGSAGVFYNKRMLLHLSNGQAKKMTAKEIEDFKKERQRIVGERGYLGGVLGVKRGEIGGDLGVIEGEGEGDGDLKTKTKDGRQKTPTPKPASPGYQFLIDHFFETWEKQKGLKLTWFGADGRLLKDLMRKQGVDTIGTVWDFYLVNPDYFASKNGQNFKNFVACFDKTQSRMQKDPWDSEEGKQLAASVERHLKPKQDTP